MEVLDCLSSLYAPYVSQAPFGCGGGIDSSEALAAVANKKETTDEEMVVKPSLSGSLYCGS
jgi:hypothetical protein